jgi:glycosyltransferase involved in cell wall biosynthesis
MKILFTLARPIDRQNGIRTFINESVKILWRLGHQVDVLVDTVPIPPAVFDGDGQLVINYSQDIEDWFANNYKGGYDLIIGNDVQSTNGILRNPHGARVIHYIHTGGLIGQNLTCLTDDYVDRERELIARCEVAGPHAIMLRNAAGKEGHVIHLPLDYDPLLPVKGEEQSGIMFIGEGVARKGAVDFIDYVRAGNYEAKIISGAHNDYFEDRGFNPKFFDADHQDEKYNFIRSAAIGIHPSHCETWGYVVMEMLLSKPVIVPAEFAWSEPLVDLGAVRVPKHEVLPTIERLLGQPHSNAKVLDYLNEAENCWKRLLQ